MLIKFFFTFRRRNLSVLTNIFLYAIIYACKYERLKPLTCMKEILEEISKMKRSMFHKVVCLILSVTFVLSTFVIGASAGQYKPNSTSSTLEEMKALVGTSSYEDYMADYGDTVNPDGLAPIIIDVTDFIANNGDVAVTKDSEYCTNSFTDYPSSWVNFDKYGNGNAESTVYLSTIDDDGKASSASWNFTVTKDMVGLYYLQIEYYNCKTSQSSVSAIQRKLMIDDKVPFSEVRSITFDKHWSYNNYTVSDPVVVSDTVEKTEVTYDHNNDGYFKYVTRIYRDTADGQMKKVVTTYHIAQDINGNSMAPVASESSEWSTYICSDESGYYDGYFNFHLAEGTHTLTLESEREPVIIKSIKFIPATTVESTTPTYEEYIAHHAGATKADGGIITLEAEFPYFVSDSSVAGSNDNTSAITYPVTPKAQLFNVIGETGFGTVGQWAAYRFTVNKTGMYNLSMRFKQSALEGMFVCRAIKLAGGKDYVYGLADGSPTVPFVEAYNARFDYSKDWQSDYIGSYVNGEKQVFEFYFEEGQEYTLYIECALGDLKDYIRTIETSLANLNDAYLKIIQYTGTDPDVNQNYKFHEKLPEVLLALLQEAQTLTIVADELQKLCGTNGAHIATLDTVARVLYTMGKDNGTKIAENLSTFKSHLGTIGTWINDSKQGSMMIDSICVVPVQTTEKIPYAKANFFQSIWFEIRSFIYSFFTNYEQMGLTSIPEEGSNTIDVWLAMGRDQSQIWRSMIDAEDGFTKTYGNAVALKLVTGGTLLPSILSGKGPDVYLGLGSADVINYAIRDAVVGVNGNDPHLTAEENKVFSNFVYETTDQNAPKQLFYEKNQLSAEEMQSRGLKLVSTAFDQLVADSFRPAAMRTLTIYSPDNAGKPDGQRDVTYGIPMTMSFAMMFYRMDILAELNQEVPETWDQLLEILPVFQANNMDIGVSYISALDFMMYQMGGSMWKYDDDSIYDSKYAGAKIDLDSEIALEAFEFVCRLYTDYSFPVSFNTANRFRTGEMPITIGDYASIYNTLVIYATDIAGTWEFGSLPGSVNRKTGEINYNSLAGISASVILNGCDNMLAAWQFLQWQTSAKVQATYANRIVALIGPAAKYESANVNAVMDMSWTAKEKEAITEQMANLDAIVNYPGSYIYSRYMQFAFLDVYNDDANAHDSMMGYIDAINAEIARKRDEFGLWVPSTEMPEPPMKSGTSDQD